jgi:hypothetical protein
VRLADGAVLGEAVVNELDAPNAAANFRIALVGPEAFGQGYGTEATRLVVAYALDVAGLHRLHLEVYDFNRGRGAPTRSAGSSSRACTATRSTGRAPARRDLDGDPRDRPAAYRRRAMNSAVAALTASGSEALRKCWPPSTTRSSASGLLTNSPISSSALAME